MRTTVQHLLESADSSDRLTTGEAAALLGVTRQHVVNLCERGDLPFEYVGAHRRILRADLERYRYGSVRMTADQHRSWRLGIAIAGRVAIDPAGSLELARQNLVRMQAAHPRGQAAHWLAAWAALVDGPVDDLLTALTSRSGRSRELRQNSPFAGVLSDEDRRAVLESAR